MNIERGGKSSKLKFGCLLLAGGAFLWLCWVAVSTAAPMAMIVVNALAVVVTVGVVAVPSVRRGVGGLMRRSFPALSPVVIAVVVILIAGSGAAMSIVSLLDPPTHPETQGRVETSSSMEGGGHNEQEVTPPDSIPQRQDGGGEASAGGAGADVETEVEVPTKAEFAIDLAYRRASEQHPDRDNYKTVARSRRITSEEVTDACFKVGLFRQHLEGEVKRVIQQGVTGRIDREGITVLPGEPGPLTVSLSLTVIGCPSGGLPDERLDLLTREALTQVSKNLPDAVDGYHASLWYEGIGCSRGSLGSATWSKEGKRLASR